MDRNKVKDRMKKITDNKIYVQIYKILRTDPSFKPSVNKNGIYYDMVPLDETTVETINDIITESVKQDVNEKIVYESYYNETDEHKLTKQLIKLNLY